MVEQESVITESVTEYEPADYVTITNQLIGSYEVNMVSGSGTSSKPIVSPGSESNPLILISSLEDVRSSVDVWYRSTVMGTFDYLVKSSDRFKFTVYLLSDSVKVAYREYSDTLSAQGTIVVYGATTAYLHVVSQRPTAKTCLVAPHVDTKNLSYGGAWVADEFGGSGTKERTPIKALYYPANKIGYLVTALQEDEYIQHIRAVATGAIEIAMAVETIAEGVAAAYTAGVAMIPAAVIRVQYRWIVETLIDKTLMDWLETAAIDKIKEISDYDLESGPTGKAFHGVALTITRNEIGVQAYYPEVWDGPKAEGPKGAKGTFVDFPEKGDDV